MSAHLFGGLIIAVWLAPAVLTAYLIWREVTAMEHEPDPVFTSEDWDQVDALLRDAV